MRRFGLLIIPILVIDVIISAYLHRPDTLISTNNSKLSSYTNQRNSNNHKLSNNRDTVKFSYLLDSLPQWPVTGIRFEPIERLLIHESDSLKFTAHSSSQSSDEQKVILVLWAEALPTNTAEQGKIPEIPLYSKVTLKDTASNYSIAKSDFYIPVWWLDQQGMDQNQIPQTNLNHIHALGIRSGYAPIKNTQHHFAIHSIKHQSNNSPIYITQIFILLILIIIYLFYKKQQPTLIVPVKENINSKHFNNATLVLILDTLRKHSDNPQLTLFDLQQLTQIPEGQISKLIKEEFKMSFKQYLNTVRIAIATELLKETTLSIKEIVNKSGYQTSSHFFRVFKSHTGQSPSEFRNTIKNNS